MKQFAAILFFLISFSETFSQTCNPQQMQLYQVRAKGTDLNIDWELNRDHAFYNLSCSFSKNTLVVHLVGSFDNPSSTLKFPSLAANNGFHVASLKYPNGTTAQTACGNSSDPDCYLKFRREILEGLDLSTETDVPVAESVYNRLEKLLTFLANEYPADGWGQYLNGTEIAWSDVIVSGHSQGGGHAAVIAMTKPVKRVLMFASSNDYSELFSAAAPWTDAPHITEDSAYFGFNNINDGVVDFSDQFEVWDNLGMTPFGDSIKVDNTTVPYNFSHQLYTDYDTTGIGGNHSVMILDSKTPVNAQGEPIFAPVWEYIGAARWANFCSSIIVKRSGVYRFSKSCYFRSGANQVFQSVGERQGHFRF